MPEKHANELLVYRHHDPGERLPAVLEEMKTKGAPRIRVFEHRNRFYINDGVHRLTAAKQLGLNPHFLIVGEGLAKNVYVEPLFEEGDDYDVESLRHTTTVEETVASLVQHVAENKIDPLQFPADCKRSYAQHCNACRRLYFPPTTSCGCPPSG